MISHPPLDQSSRLGNISNQLPTPIPARLLHTRGSLQQDECFLPEREDLRAERFGGPESRPGASGTRDKPRPARRAHPGQRCSRYREPRGLTLTRSSWLKIEKIKSFAGGLFGSPTKKKTRKKNPKLSFSRYVFSENPPSMPPICLY